MTPASTNRIVIAMLDTLSSEYLQGKEEVLRLALIALLTGEGYGPRVIQGRQGLFEIADATGNAAVREFVTIYAGALYRDRRLATDEVLTLRRILKKGFHAGGECPHVFTESRISRPLVLVLDDH